MSIPSERWLAVAGYEGHYEVSCLGRVRSLKREVVNSLGRIYPVAERLLRQTINGAGYPYVCPWKSGRQQNYYVHRLVLETFVGRCPPGMEACHNDGNPLNSKLENLRWDTRESNMADMNRHGTNNRLRRTHCPESHPLIMPNLIPSQASRGKRQCLACNRARSNGQKARKSGQPFDFKSVADWHFAKIMGGVR
jgi:hypothetical protein